MVGWSLKPLNNKKRRTELLEYQISRKDRLLKKKYIGV